MNKKVSKFIGYFSKWASSQPGIDCALLVGSQACGQAREDSDVDLVLIAADPESFFTDQTWVGAFGEPVESSREDWGKVQSLRVIFSDNLEVEFGFTTRDWVAMPMDTGTARVLDNGFVVLVDKKQIVSNFGREKLKTLKYKNKNSSSAKSL